MEMWHSPVGKPNDRHTEPGRMKQKKDVPQGTLALIVLKTLDVLGPLHGYGIARRIERLLILLGVGSGIGLLLNVLLHRVVASVVAIQFARDGAMIAALVIGLGFAGTPAAPVPVRRATSIDPMRALRSE
jgi:hypothetical protein